MWLGADGHSVFATRCCSSRFGLTGKGAAHDIKIVREGLVNEVLSDVRIVERNTNREGGTCSSTAVIPKRNSFPNAAPSDRTNAEPR